MTALRELLRAGAATLAEAGVASPEHDARALAAHVLGLAGQGELLRVDTVGPEEAERYRELVGRRAERVPLQHLVGSAGFRYLDLQVGPGVFVPRPETESVVQWAVDAVRREGWREPLVVDLCTGAGTVALAIANEVPDARVHAVERDPAALEWAARNAAERASQGDPPVQLHLGSVEDALTELDGTVDLVASNPPYVALSEAHLPDPEVVDHDPGIALWAGEDGLEVIRLVEQAARRLLRPGGLVVVEHSDRQGHTAPAVFGEGWTDVRDHVDLAGRDRFVTARRVEQP